MTTCKICSQPVYRESDLCLIHHALRLWSKNESIDELGFISFCKKVIPKAFKGFKYGVPYFFKEIVWEILTDAKDWIVFNRMIVIAAPRGSSKTTLVSKAFVLYCVLFKKKRYIVIASKTARQSQKILRWIKNALSSKTVITFFGDLRPNTRAKNLTIDALEEKWTSEIIILNNGVTVEAIGMGQAVRSSAEGEDSDRIDLLIMDDVESDDNTRTPERRENNEVWLFEQMLPSLDIDTGTVVFIGTIQHTEGLLNKLLNSESWRKKFYQITQVRDGVEVPLWPEKFPMNSITGIRQSFKDAGRDKSFWKEYYNIIVSDAGFDPKWIKRYSGRVIHREGMNWLELQSTSDDWVKGYRIFPCNLTLGVDLAFSQATSADYTALLLMACIPGNKRFIVKYTRARMTVYDKSEGLEIVTRGFVDEICRLRQVFIMNSIVVGVEGQQVGYVEDIKEGLNKKRLPTYVIYHRNPNSRSKLDLIREELQPLYEAGYIYHQENSDDLDRELISMGDTTDDLVDAENMASRYIREPSGYQYIDTTTHLVRGLPTPAESSYERNTNWMVL